MSIVASPDARAVSDEPVVGCPSWCVAHFSSGADVHHRGQEYAYYGTGVSAMGPQVVIAGIEAHAGGEPAVVLQVGATDTGSLHLDPTTARRLALALASLADRLNDGHDSLRGADS